MASPRLSPALNVVVNAVHKAGRRLLRDFGEAEKLQVSVKGPGDFVSQADMQAEETLRRELSRARPGFAFRMEESGTSGSEDWEWRWVVDPLGAYPTASLVIARTDVDSFRLQPRDNANWFGAGLGVGWTFMGDLYRTQAYPADAVPGDQSTFVPGDPYRYVKCRGPNNPAGSFRYCNQLDYDADHYPGYVEPSWFTRPKGRPQGLRPLVYPWLVLPEIGLSFRPWDRFALDLRVGASATGVLGGFGMRIAL